MCCTSLTINTLGTTRHFVGLCVDQFTDLLLYSEKTLLGCVCVGVSCLFASPCFFFGFLCSLRLVFMRPPSPCPSRYKLHHRIGLKLCAVEDVDESSPEFHHAPAHAFKVLTPQKYGHMTRLWMGCAAFCCFVVVAITACIGAA